MRHRHDGPVSGVLAKSAVLAAAAAALTFPPPILDDLGIVAFVVLALIIVSDESAGTDRQLVSPWRRLRWCLEIALEARRILAE